MTVWTSAGQIAIQVYLFEFEAWVGLDQFWWLWQQCLIKQQPGWFGFNESNHAQPSLEKLTLGKVRLVTGADAKRETSQASIPKTKTGKSAS